MYRGTSAKLSLTNALYTPFSSVISTPFTVTCLIVLSSDTFSTFTVYCFSVPFCAFTVTVTCFDAIPVKSDKEEKEPKNKEPKVKKETKTKKTKEVAK